MSDLDQPAPKSKMPGGCRVLGVLGVGLVFIALLLVVVFQQTGFSVVHSLLPQATIAPISFNGSGTLKTRAFDVPGGNYEVKWEARPNPGVITCSHGMYFERVDGLPMVDMVPTGVVNRLEIGRASVYGAAPGAYYLEINSTCVWTVTVNSLR